MLSHTYLAGRLVTITTKQSKQGHIVNHMEQSPHTCACVCYCRAEAAVLTQATLSDSADMKHRGQSSPAVSSQETLWETDQCPITEQAVPLLNFEGCPFLPPVFVILTDMCTPVLSSLHYLPFLGIPQKFRQTIFTSLYDSF